MLTPILGLIGGLCFLGLIITMISSIIAHTPLMATVIVGIVLIVSMFVAGYAACHHGKLPTMPWDTPLTAESATP